MTLKSPKGREKEVAEIVEFDRAVEVGRLFLGKLNAPLRPIFPDNYESLTRKVLKSGKHSIRGPERREMEEFYRKNFSGKSFKSLATIYESLYKNDSQLRIPLTEFIEKIGKPKSGTLKEAPLHSTVDISVWGLQFEHPELHLVKDLEVAFNEVLDIEEEIKNYEGKAFSHLRNNRPTIAKLQRKLSFVRRMTLLSCFNLVEAYLNGLAWEFVQKVDIESFSNRQKKLLDTSRTSILDKLMKYPIICSQRDDILFSGEKPPYSIFRDLIKPFRDSIVHASPFAAPESFGGYDKLTKLYELSTETVKKAVETTLEIIKKINEFMGYNQLPHWYPETSDDGHLSVT